MAIIGANCQKCGRLELDSENPEIGFRINKCLDTGVTEYRFRCPLCKIILLDTCLPGVEKRLTELGVRVVNRVLPQELGERPGPNVAPVDCDYVLDAIADLSRMSDGEIIKACSTPEV